MSNTAMDNKSTSNGDATTPPPLNQQPPSQEAVQQLSDSVWLQQLQRQHPDPLVNKLERNMKPLEGIYQRMAEIVQNHLAQHGEIADLQEVGHECDLVLQYNRQIGRLMKLELDLRENRAKVDRLLYMEPLQPDEKKPV